MPTQEKYKVAFISNTSWSLYNFRLEVIRSLISHGVEVYLLAPKDSYSSKLVAEGAIFISIKMNNYSTNPIKDILLTAQFISLFFKHRFDLSFHYTIKPIVYGGLASIITRTKSVAVITGLGRFLRFKNPLLNWISEVLFKWSSRGYKDYWFLNTHDRDLFIKRRIVSPDRTFILPSEGINTVKYYAPQKVESSKIIRFLFAGRLLKDKGILDYVALARRIKANCQHVRFEVLGFINELNTNSVRLMDLVIWQKEGIIKYLGSTEDVRPFIRRCDCLVFPSVYQEGLSRILLEAASMEKPIITYNTPGCREVVKNFHSGFICNKPGVDDLEEKVRYLLSLSPEERSTLGSNGRSYVKRYFNMDTVINIYHSKLRSFGLLPVPDYPHKKEIIDYSYLDNIE